MFTIITEDKKSYLLNLMNEIGVDNREFCRFCGKYIVVGTDRRGKELGRIVNKNE